MISCRELLHGSEQKIYWQVINNKEICGTTRVNEASIFYIKHSCTRKQFQIIYKTEALQTKLYVVPEAQQPLKLVTSANQNEISFTLKTTSGESVDPPESKASWETNSPYFIQRPNTNRGLIFTDECYLRVEKQGYHDEQPKYTVAAAKKQEMDNGLMLFYFMPVTKLHDPVSILLRTRIQYDSSEVEDDLSQPESTGSTLGGPPPPPPPIQLQPESGSAIGGDLPNELKDFFELVGEDYIFPIQVNAEGI
jgi:hypothetical protein